MLTLKLRLSQLANTALVLAALAAIVLGGGLRAHSAIHTSTTIGQHHLADVVDPPPGH